MQEPVDMVSSDAGRPNVRRTSLIAAIAPLCTWRYIAHVCYRWPTGTHHDSVTLWGVYFIS